MNEGKSMKIGMLHLRVNVILFEWIFSVMKQSEFNEKIVYQAFTPTQYFGFKISSTRALEYWSSIRPFHKKNEQLITQKNRYKNEYHRGIQKQNLFLVSTFFCFIEPKKNKARKKSHIKNTDMYPNVNNFVGHLFENT